MYDIVKNNSNKNKILNKKKKYLNLNVLSINIYELNKITMYVINVMKKPLFDYNRHILRC